LEDERFCGSLYTLIPRRPVSLFVVRSESDRVLEWQDFETALPQVVQDTPIEQEVIWIARDPQAGEISRKFL
jgi:hypothetical protein